MPRPTRWLVSPLLMLSLFANALADEVVLKNGDRVSGKIVSQTEEEVVIETAYAGTITIITSHIEKIAGETMAPYKASATAADADAPKDVPATASPAKDAPEKATTVKIAPTLASAPRLFGGERYWGIADGWDGNASVGFSYTSGNSRQTTATSGIRAVKTGGDDKVTVYARSLWNSNRNSGRNITTQNAIWGGLRYDRNVNDRLFAFGSYDFERDRPKRLNFRSVLGGGLGHHTLKNETTEIEFIVGAAWNRTWQMGPNSDTPEALAGNTLKHKFHDRLKLQQSFSFFQNFTDRNEYRFIFDTTISADITKRIGWQFTIGDRFNNDPLRNAKKNDFLFTTGLRWNFGRKK
jgi:putative salt-induced outer membrane protein